MKEKLMILFRTKKPTGEADVPFAVQESWDIMKQIVSKSGGTTFDDNDNSADEEDDCGGT